MFQVQEEAQEGGFLLLQRLDLQGAREELRLDLGSAGALQMEDQLEAMAHLLQASQQGLLLVAAQAEVADLALLATQATAEMAGFMAAGVAVVAQVLIALVTLVLAETEQMASSL